MKRLKELRTAAGISQLALAKELKVVRSTIAMWETGGSSPDNDMLNKLADYFGVTVDYLLGRDTPEDAKKPAAPEDDGQKIDISGLSEENQRKVLEYAELLLNSQRKPEA